MQMTLKSQMRSRTSLGLRCSYNYFYATMIFDPFLHSLIIFDWLFNYLILEMLDYEEMVVTNSQTINQN